ncbi:hypothetical protein COLO4_29406 [Corchorus olitorius]|uniref:Uncharacterized protein n=1 Tax=Corchorus olitorius TaxID=93759 RepID=A0A1R3HES2_9ROSI|nr:hypothetical protein COLO4_29406 [Corchorus olitorius]
MVTWRSSDPAVASFVTASFVTSGGTESEFIGSTAAAGGGKLNRDLSSLLLLLTGTSTGSKLISFATTRSLHQITLSPPNVDGKYMFFPNLNSNSILQVTVDNATSRKAILVKVVPEETCPTAESIASNSASTMPNSS